MINERTLFISAAVMVMLIPLTVMGQDLTAGDFDDNLNYDHLQEYLDDLYGSDPNMVLPRLNLSGRVTVRVTDKDGDPVSNAKVKISMEGSQERPLTSYAGYNGAFQFFPGYDFKNWSTSFKIEAGPPTGDAGWESTSIDISQLDGTRTVDLKLAEVDAELPDGMDLVFVIDVTGSMSDELRYITNEFVSIIENVSGQSQQGSIRYGLVVYRDHGDQFVVRSLGFTESLTTMQSWLKNQSADGGGDYEEAVDEALAEAMELEWNTGNVARLMFHVADAPPHDQMLDDALIPIRTAREKGIHIYPLAASGVAGKAEYIMRMAEVLTHGRYMFLTDDSGIGNPHAEPHIPAYVVTTLKDLFIRVVNTELTGKRVEPSGDEILRRVGTLKDGVVVQPPKDDEQEDDNKSGTANGTGGQGGTGGGATNLSDPDKNSSSGHNGTGGDSETPPDHETDPYSDLYDTETGTDGSGTDALPPSDSSGSTDSGGFIPSKDAVGDTDDHLAGDYSDTEGPASPPAGLDSDDGWVHPSDDDDDGSYEKESRSTPGFAAITAVLSICLLLLLAGKRNRKMGIDRP